MSGYKIDITFIKLPNLFLAQYEIPEKLLPTRLAVQLSTRILVDLRRET